ncbi:hypothetical protein CRUP_029010 [Coryphaenoides rupestris]|nr:hypothetical protein CRUP_029010 [Coryphaenoides rupestris]
MIICANKMEYPLRSQCQRVQKQVMVNTEKERASLLFMQALASRGSVDAVSHQMASHPQYLESFLRSQHYILHMDGPLPLPCRHYIAIMAASRHHCSYLVSLHSADFLRVGGDPVWLQGLEAAPARLRLLDHINKVLAHQPWLTACSHIQTLLKTGGQCWSLAELVQAVVLLAHCHALCSFVFGSASGTVCDLASLPKSPGTGTPPAYCSCDAANGNANVPVDITRRRSLDSSTEMFFLRERIQKSQEEREKREERLLHVHTLQQTELEEEEEAAVCLAEPARFISDPDFCYQDFARREEDHFQVFRVQDYSWEDHGFSLVNRLYSDIGHLLDDRFRSVASLPSSHSPDLKRAIWNYIHCVLGIRPLCCPLPWAPLKPSERIHVNLLIMEARLQAELLYALRAITQYMIA